MDLKVLLICLLVPCAVAAEEKEAAAEAAATKKSTEKDQKLKKIEGKDIGYGYGYGPNHHNGYHGNSYGHHGNGGHYGHGHHGHYANHAVGHHEPKHVPIKLPYLDRNGCRFAGDVVCDDTSAADIADQDSFEYCLLTNENKNLWKKPSFTTVVITCTVHLNAASFVLRDFCNDNVRLLRAAGLMQGKDKHDSYKRFHQGAYSVMLNPCIMNTDPTP